MRGFLAFLTLLLLSPTICYGQEIVWERVGAVDRDRQRGQIAVLGDLDGDGFDDIVQIMEVVRASTCGPHSELWFFSGRDGSVLRVRGQYGPCRAFQRISSAGDVDGDGSGDYATTVIDGFTGSHTLVEVRRGLDDGLVWQIQRHPLDGFGLGIVGDLDLDGDRRPDLIVTSPTLSPFGRIYAFSSRGTLLYQLDGTSQLWFSFQFQCLGKVGDVDGDGCDDFVAGGEEPTGRGAAALISGRNGIVLRIGMGEQPGDRLGWSVDGCGDVDRDGITDFVAGSSGTICCRGIVRMFSGATGQPIHTWVEAHSSSDFGFTLVGGGLDHDRDGVPDVIVTANQEIDGVIRGRGAVYALSGRDGSRIFRQFPVRSPFLAGMPPQPNHPWAGFLVGDPDWWTAGQILYGQGKLTYFRSSPAGLLPIGDGCSGTLSEPPQMGLRHLRHVTPGGTGVRVTLNADAPGGLAGLLVGFSNQTWLGIPLPLALDPLGFAGCRLHTSVDLSFATWIGTSGLSMGYSSVDLPFRLNGGGLGSFDVHAQWIVFSPTGLPGALSDALTWSYR